VKKNTAPFKKKTTINVQPKRPAVPGTTLNNNSRNATVKSMVALNFGWNWEMMRDVINSPIINKLNMPLASSQESYTKIGHLHLPFREPHPFSREASCQEIQLKKP